MNLLPEVQVPAPVGWGFIPGADILARQLPDLPDLPDGPNLTARMVAAVDMVPELIPTLTARKLMERYDCKRSTANDVVRKVQR